MAKRIKNKSREKARRAIISNLTTRLIDKLAAISWNSPTMRECVELQVEYYYTCNPTEQEILMKMFKENEDETLTALAYR